MSTPPTQTPPTQSLPLTPPTQPPPSPPPPTSTSVNPKPLLKRTASLLEPSHYSLPSTQPKSTKRQRIAKMKEEAESKHKKAAETTTTAATTTSIIIALQPTPPPPQLIQQDSDLLISTLDRWEKHKPGLGYEKTKTGIPYVYTVGAPMLCGQPNLAISGLDPTAGFELLELLYPKMRDALVKWKDGDILRAKEFGLITDLRIREVKTVSTYLSRTTDMHIITSSENSKTCTAFGRVFQLMLPLHNNVTHAPKQFDL